MSTGIRETPTAPRIATIRHATTMKYGVAIANFDMVGACLYLRGRGELCRNLVARVQPGLPAGDYLLPFSNAGDDLHVVRIFDSELHWNDADRARRIDCIHARRIPRALDRFERQRQHVLLLLHLEFNARIHSRQDHPRGILDVDFRDHGAGRGIYSRCEARHASFERPPQRLNPHFHRPADAHRRGERLRYRQAQAKCAELRKAHQRHRLRLRRNARLDHRAEVCETFGHCARKRCRNRDVVAHGLQARFLRPGHARLLLFHAQPALRGRDLRLGHQIFRAHLVHFLLRYQAGLTLRHHFDARIRKVGNLVTRFRALQIVSRGRDLGAALLDTGGRLRDLVRHFRNFQLGEQLPLAHVISQVHFDRADIAGDLRHHVHLLERLELRGHCHCVGHVAAYRRGHRHRDRRTGIGGAHMREFGPRARYRHAASTRRAAANGRRDAGIIEVLLLQIRDWRHAADSRISRGRNSFALRSARAAPASVR